MWKDCAVSNENLDTIYICIVLYVLCAELACVLWRLKVRCIKALQEEFTVKITVEKGQRINRIRIQGPPNEVTSALDKIHHIFHEVTKQEHENFIGGQVDNSIVHTVSVMCCLRVVDCMSNVFVHRL